MNLQGDFEGLTLASILQLLCNDQRSGVLTVSRDKEESRVYFDRGTIVYASATLKQSRLGYLLRNDGVISADQLQKCLDFAKAQKVHLGKMLVDKGYISLDVLRKYNTRQVEAIIYDLLFWEKGVFEYRETRLNLQNLIVAQLNPMKLILEASRRIDELSILKKVIPSDKLVYRMSGKLKSEENIKLNANEWRVLTLIDGSRTVRQVITESGYDEFAVYKILYAVISSGLIEQKEEVSLGSDEQGDCLSGVITVFTDILVVVDKYLSEEMGNRTRSLFEEALSDLEPTYQELLRGMDIRNEKNANLKALQTALKQMEAVRDTQQAFVISGFVAYCGYLLRRAGGILGQQPLSGALTDIEKVMGYISRYQTGSGDKDRIVNEMNGLIAQLRSDFGIDKTDGKPKKGLFSLFS